MAITKQYWTATQILQRVKDELDLDEETFIDDPEMLRYCNAAIDRAEQRLIGIHVDYFLTSSSLTGNGALASGTYLTHSFVADNIGVGGNSISLVFDGALTVTAVIGVWNAANPDNTVSILSGSGATVLAAGTLQLSGGVNDIGITSGVREYKLPADIYAHKIRRVIYENGSQVYKLTRIQDWKKFERMAIEDVNNSATLYEYFLVNRVPGEPRINMVPVPNETGDFVTVWYCRQANRFNDADVGDVDNILDIPEAFNYVVEFVKMKCDIKEKRRMGQMEMGEYPEVALEMEQMMGALQEIVPDAENLIEPDYSTYEEHS